MKLPRTMYRKIFPALTAALLGLLLLLPIGALKPLSVSLPSAEGGFFSSDLELFEEVLDLVGDKYIYSPDYKKMFTASVDEMVRTLDDKDVSLRNELTGQSISKFNKNIRYTLGYN